ncbi:FixH family protein [Candidatus Nitrosocosmicus arcticus]|nr:FixH family protein [Candidatus Nitrosocosmicus arcticus]
MIIVFLFSLLFAFHAYHFKAFSQSDATSSIVKNDSWISERNNLNMTIKLEPVVPVIDETTKISFEVTYLDNSKPFEDLNTRVTITDHDGRLYKFENKLVPVIDGQFSVNYIFPDDGEHRIILQLYKNTTPFTVSSFDLVIPHSTLPSENNGMLKPLVEFFNSFL